MHGKQFTVVTDHLSLKSLLDFKDPSQKLARWFLHLQDFGFSTEHRDGPELVVHEALSRVETRTEGTVSWMLPPAEIS